MNELFIAVDSDLETAPFQQIMNQLRGFIERGDLHAGDPLPTVRQLAGDLGVAPNTVARAYADLQEQGWLTSEGRRGTRVATHAPTNDKRTRTRILREAVAHFIGTLTHRGYSEDEVATALQPFGKP
ncbi:MAG: GntR family transcriptional regulator [Candidatus Eremiobacteraeota bacterium]|nr:GntR family transcriptional regulator [Candidatus Eremiobacteraeota bacterium]